MDEGRGEGGLRACISSITFSGWGGEEGKRVSIHSLRRTFTAVDEGRWEEGQQARIVDSIDSGGRRAGGMPPPLLLRRHSTGNERKY